MKYYAVIDTNVIVSAMLKANSAPWEIIAAIDEGHIIPLLNNEILEEYTDVLSRDKFHFALSAVYSLIEGLKSKAVFINSDLKTDLFPDPDDAVFYEVVMEARKNTDAYLITGNIKHFPKKPYVVTPREMLNIIYNN